MLRYIHSQKSQYLFPRFIFTGTLSTVLYYVHKIPSKTRYEFIAGLIPSENGLLGVVLRSNRKPLRLITVHFRLMLIPLVKSSNNYTLHIDGCRKRVVLLKSMHYAIPDRQEQFPAIFALLSWSSLTSAGHDGARRRFEKKIPPPYAYSI